MNNRREKMENRKFRKAAFFCLLVAGLSFYMTACNSAKNNDSSTDTLYGVNSTDSAGNLNKTRFSGNASERRSAADLVSIYSSSLFSLKLSQDALAHDISPETKNAATYLIKNQTAFNKQMAQMAEELGVSLPNNIDKDQQKELIDLKQKNGPKYEQNYFNLILFQQKKALSALKSAQDSNNDTIQQWAKESIQKVNQYIDTITTGQKHADSLDMNHGG